MSGTLRILVVDDDHTMAKTLADIFKVSGYDAEVAHSGSEALEKMQWHLSSTQNRQFDCVLTDIRMLGMNGVELQRAIKARHPDLPVVLMTAYSTDKLVEEGLRAGAIAAFTKPVNIDTLLDLFSSLHR